jgi:arylsulfatase A-like enzyme
MDSISGWLPFWCTAMQNPWTAYPWILYLAQNVFGFHHDNRENHDYDPAIAESRASSWLHGQQARPIFLWVHFFPPHDPYATPKPWLQSFDDSPLAITAADSSSTYYYDWAATSSVRRRVLEARYEEAIAYVDHSVGELIADIQERLGPNTVIIVTADHGESFQHGYGGHGGPALYEELVHIPLIIKLPQPLNAPGRRSERVEQIDIAPTIADLAGIEKSPMWEGRSLVAVPSEPSNSHTVYSMNFEENPARGELTTGSVATLGGSWKLIEFMGRLHYSRMPKPETLLFDLTIDPLELHNVASEHPDIVRELAAQRATDMAPHQGPVAR